MSLSTRTAEPSSLRRPLGDQEKPESRGGAFPSPAAPSQQRNGKPSLDEIAKLFSLPIAEAASVLGVSDSVLKRICRENGIVRWPYRKFISGKAVEDIKRDATWEINKVVDGSLAKDSIHVSTLTASTSASFAAFFGNHTQGIAPGLVKNTSESALQQAFPMAGQVLSSQGNRFMQYGWSGISLPIQSKNISTHRDEFEYGFPSDGLSSISVKWWGDSGGEASTITDANVQALERVAAGDTNSNCTRHEEYDSNIDDSTKENDPSSSLCLLRKRCAEQGHQALKNGFFNGWDSSYLTKRRKLLLSQVFEASVPSQWKDSTCNL